MISWHWTVGIAVGLVACVSAWPTIAPRTYHRTASISGAELVGAEECSVCHDTVRGHLPAPTYHSDCESCHGPGSLHANSEETALIRFPADSDCLACHDGRRSQLAWTGADHKRSGVMCSDCHDPHNQELKNVRAPPVGEVPVRYADTTVQLCMSCHVAVAARLQLPSHHPVLEGMLGCTDCHQPHGSQVVRLGTPNERCSSCHQDKIGPWVFEHVPVAEDCGYCHKPHGTFAQDLLGSSQPASCINCHSLPSLGAPHNPSAFGSSCTDCHSAIHGSYSDPHLRQ